VLALRRWPFDFRLLLHQTAQLCEIWGETVTVTKGLQNA
jgi:hypothetical protein